MRTTFSLALLCLIFTSCSKESDHQAQYTITENRTSNPLKIAYLQVNNDEVNLTCFKIKCTALNNSFLTLDIYTTSQNYYTVIAAQATIENSNGFINCLSANTEIYEDINLAKLIPYSSTQIKLFDHSIEKGSSNSFIGEEGDGI